MKIPFLAYIKVTASLPKSSKLLMAKIVTTVIKEVKILMNELGAFVLLRSG
jgi:hypothetical protein